MTLTVRILLAKASVTNNAPPLVIVSTWTAGKTYEYTTLKRVCARIAHTGFVHAFCMFNSLPQIWRSPQGRDHRQRPQIDLSMSATP